MCTLLLLKGAKLAKSLTAAQNEHASLSRSCFNGFIIHGAYVGYDVQNQSWIAVGVEKQHVPNGPISQGRAVDWNFILPGPVVDAVFVSNLLSQASDHLQMS